MQKKFLLLFLLFASSSLFAAGINKEIMHACEAAVEYKKRLEFYNSTENLHEKDLELLYLAGVCDGFILGFAAINTARHCMKDELTPEYVLKALNKIKRDGLGIISLDYYPISFILKEQMDEDYPCFSSSDENKRVKRRRTPILSRHFHHH